MRVFYCLKSGGFLGGFFEVVSKRLNFVNTWIRNLPLGQFSQPRIVETSVTADTSPASFALLEPFLDKRINSHGRILAKFCYENKPHFANQKFDNLGLEKSSKLTLAENMRGYPLFEVENLKQGQNGNQREKYQNFACTANKVLLKFTPSQQNTRRTAL